MMPLPNLVAEVRQDMPDGSGPGSEAAPQSFEFQSSIHPQQFVIPGEDPAELAAVIESYRRSYLPGTALEWFLVDAMIAADWGMRRVRKIQMQVLQREIKEGATLEEVYTGSKVYQKLERKEAAVQRSFFRAFKEIEKILGEEEKAQSPEKRDQKEPGRRLGATLSAMTKLGSFRQRRVRGPLREGGGSVAEAENTGGVGRTPGP